MANRCMQISAQDQKCPALTLLSMHLELKIVSTFLHATHWFCMPNSDLHDQCWAMAHAMHQCHAKQLTVALLSICSRVDSLVFVFNAQSVSWCNGRKSDCALLENAASHHPPPSTSAICESVLTCAPVLPLTLVHTVA